ncbi:MAG: hypothetical protein ACLGP3_11485, partial [Acidobacteriota bacterium]
MRESTRRGRRWLKWFGAALLAVLIMAGIGTAIAVRHAEPFLRALIVDRLAQRFHARVELDSFHISLAQGLRAEGKGLRIWPPAEIDGLELAAARGKAQPLIDLQEFYFRAPLHFAPGKPIRIWAITLEGLTVTVPPRPRRASAADRSASAPVPAIPLPRGAELLHFQIDSVMCRNAHLIVENANPAKQPLQFEITTIDVTHLNPAGKMDFQAELINPRPKGLIATRGSLGPWVVRDPGETPLEGNYRFEHADLSTFTGIAGMMSSTGSYQGAIRDMTVDGETQTPAFSLTHFGTPVPLRTTFHARVDGTNGDTWLEPVRATLGSTKFIASGKIVQLPAADGNRGPMHSAGRQITLNVDVEQGQIADFLRLASHSGDPIVTGTLHMKTTFDLPPGTEAIHDRMRLKGNFALDDALFTNPKLQDRIGSLSLRSRGESRQSKTDAVTDVRSSMEGDFTMAGGAVDLPNLHFTVPGAEIRLNGVYGLDGGTLAFHGVARLQAPASKLVGGWKGWLLKPA